MIFNLDLILLTFFGLLVLLISAHCLIENISDLAKKLNVSQFIIASCTIALGTSIPELSASIKSVYSGYSGIAVGNLVGSNIANILLVIGLSATIYPLKIHSEDVIKLETVASIFVVIFPAIFLLRLSSAESIMVSMLAILLFIYFFLQRINIEKLNTKKIPSIKKTTFSLILKNIFFIAGLVLGSHLLIDSAVKLAETYTISERVIGLSLVAIGTSLPELTICVAAALKQKQGVAMGTVLGSNMYNILAMLSAVEIYENIGGRNGAILKNIEISDIIFLALSTLLVFIFIMFPKKPKIIDRREGNILFIFYIVYIFLIFKG